MLRGALLRPPNGGGGLHRHRPSLGAHRLGRDNRQERGRRLGGQDILQVLRWEVVRRFTSSFSFLFGRKEKRKKQREKKSPTETINLKERENRSFQSVKKVAECHFFEFYGFCLAKKMRFRPGKRAGTDPLRRASGRQNPQSTKTYGFSSILTHMSSEPD